MSAREQQPVLRVLQAGVEAWNRGDLDAYLESYAEQARWISSAGVTQGRARIAHAYRDRFGDAASMGQLELLDPRVESSSEREALLSGRWQLTCDSAVQRGFFTVHLRRLGDAWRIVYDHSSAQA